MTLKCKNILMKKNNDKQISQLNYICGCSVYAYIVMAAATLTLTNLTKAAD